MNCPAVVIVCFDEFPHHREYRNAIAQNRAFAVSGKAMESYFLKSGVPQSQLLRISQVTSPLDALASIKRFCEGLFGLAVTQRPRDLILILIGHGVVSDRHSYRFLLSCSESNSEATTLGVAEVFECVREITWAKKRPMRLLGLIDTCYASHLAIELEQRMNLPLTRWEGDGPPRGLTLLCSTGSQELAISRSHGECTQFIDAFLNVVGNAEPSDPLIGIRDIGDRLELYLKENYEEQEYVLPSLRRIISVDGDIANWPLFAAKNIGEQAVRKRTKRWQLIEGTTRLARTPAGIILAVAMLTFALMPFVMPTEMEPRSASSPAGAPPLAKLDLDEVDLPSAELLSVKPHVDLSRLQILVCNRCGFPIELIFVNCTVLASERQLLPIDAWKNLSLGRQFTLGIEPLSSKVLSDVRPPFTEKSGAGWYALFARPVTSPESAWQRLKDSRPLDASHAVPLFRKPSSLIIIKNLFQELQLEIHQDDKAQECISAA